MDKELELEVDRQLQARVEIAAILIKRLRASKDLADIVALDCVESYFGTKRRFEAPSFLRVWKSKLIDIFEALSPIPEALGVIALITSFIFILYLTKKIEYPVVFNISDTFQFGKDRYCLDEKECISPKLHEGLNFEFKDLQEGRTNEVKFANDGKNYVITKQGHTFRVEVSK